MRSFPGRLITSLCLGIALSAPVVCQEQAPAQKIPCTVFPFQSLAGGAGSADFEQTITDSVSAALSVGGLTVLTPSAWAEDVKRRNVSSRALLDAAEALATAKTAGAGVAVTGYYTLQDQRIVVFLQCWDVKTGRLLASLQQGARFNLAFYSALHDHIVELLPRISEARAPATGIAAAPGKFALSEIDFLSADEGMEILVAGDKSLGTVSSGKLVWKNPGVSPGETLAIVERKSGFHGESVSVRAAQEIKLSRLVRESKLGGDVFLSSGQLLGLGLGARAYVDPDWTFFSAGAYPFWQIPLSTSSHYVGHVDVNFSLGAYIGTPPDWPVRFGVSAGAGAIVTPAFVSDGISYADAYLDVFNWWVETRVLGPLIFVRQDWKYALGLGTNLLGTGWIMANDFPLTEFGISLQW